MNNDDVKVEEKVVEEVTKEEILDVEGNVVDIESNEEFMTMGEGEENE